jgi:plasmid replication initiation protein
VTKIVKGIDKNIILIILFSEGFHSNTFYASEPLEKSELMSGKTNELVKESNVVARAKVKPTARSVWEERVIAVIVAQNRVEDKVFQEHLIPFNEFTKEEALSTRQHREAKKAVERLSQTTYVIPVQSRGFKAFPIFAYIGIDDDGNIRAKLNSSLREHYLGLHKEFSVRSLGEFSKLTSTYSQQLFRMLNSWKGMPEITVSLEELHFALSVPPTFRKNFSLFRLNVLKVAHQEINTKTDLYFDWEPVRKGLRKVTGVKFVFAAAKVEANAKTAEQKAREEREKLRVSANKCWERFSAKGESCKPQKTSARCVVCCEAGRMAAQKMLNLQGRLPFEEPS